MDISDENVTTFVTAMRHEIGCWAIESRPSPIIGGPPTYLLHDGKRVVLHLINADDPPPAVEQMTFPDSLRASNEITHRAVRAGLEAVLGGRENG